MKQYSVDIHCHTTLKPFNANYPNAPKSVWKDFSNKCHRNSRDILNLEKGTLKGTQTSLRQAALGNVKIIGVSLMTYERGYTPYRKFNELAKKSLISCLTGLSRKKIDTIHDGQTGEEIFNDIQNEFIFLANEIKQTYKIGQTTWNIEFLTKGILKKLYNGDIDLD